MTSLCSGRLISLTTFVVISFSFFSNTLAFQPNLSLPSNQVAPLSLASKDNVTNPPINGGATVLKSILQKPSKVLTVGLEYISTEKHPSSSSSSQDIATLSMQLRKLKVSAIWCDDIESLQEFTKEQETAQGNFPGPCPIIYHGPLEQHSLAAVSEYGAAAVVVPADVIPNFDGGDGEQEIIWKVSSVEHVGAVLERMGGVASSDIVFWLDDVPLDAMENVVACVPKDSMFIASVNPMQSDGAEVDIGKKYKGMGCASIVVRRACVGDAEDLEYAQFLVGGFTSKASSKFKFTGFTESMYHM